MVTNITRFPNIDARAAICCDAMREALRPDQMRWDVGRSQAERNSDICQH